MSVKKAHALNHAYEQLCVALQIHGRMVSAGEVAKVMGVSRNTAQKRLFEMVTLDTIRWESQPYKKGFCMRYGIWSDA